MVLRKKGKKDQTEHDSVHQFRTFATSEDFEAWQRDRGETTIIYSMQPVVICTIGYRDAGDAKEQRELGRSYGREGRPPRGNVHGLFVIFFEVEESPRV